MIQRFALFFLVAVCFLTSSGLHKADVEASWERFAIDFYGQRIQVEFDPAMRIDIPRSLNYAAIDRGYTDLQSRPSYVFLNSLNEARERYQLNDYLFYKLARNCMAYIYDGDYSSAREIGLFDLLAEAGFDARLTFRTSGAFVNVYTDEELFEVPIIDDSGRSYANVSCLNGECTVRQSLYIYNRRPNPRGRSFSFKLPSWPELNSRPQHKRLNFSFHGNSQSLEVDYDATMVDIMADYPFVDEYCYLETPFSPVLSASLLPQLRRSMLELNLDLQGRLEYLASFTRSAFDYKEDNEHFGRSKPMVPEELFKYDFSDCEDRSALFFALVRDLLDLPMAVIAYDDHLTVAVATSEVKGDDFILDGQRYIFVDPTGPSNSSRIGRIPPGYESKPYTIIGRYK
ncbi:MAG: hypothetical protein AAFY91_00590 [Bacteroidota bacterium]